MKPYFCFLEYFATCEGLTYCMAVVGADNEEDAKKKFVREHMCNELFAEEHIQECVTYFSRGVYVYDFHDANNHDKIKDILKSFFSQAVMDSMFDAEKSHALHEFNFKIYTNYS